MENFKPKAKPSIRHIDPATLNNLPSRVAYLCSFIGFTAADAAALHDAAPYLAPLIPTVVDLVYEKLLSYDITARSFVPRQTGYTGEAPTKLEDLSPDHPQIQFRKDFLRGYVGHLVTKDYDKDETWEYLDRVGIMHTGVAAFKHRHVAEKKPALRVEYMHCAVLLGYVEDILVNAVATHPDLELDTKVVVMRAVNKILWIQNDLFARHYITELDPPPPPAPAPSAFTLEMLVTPSALVTIGGLSAIGAIALNMLVPRGLR